MRIRTLNDVMLPYRPSGLPDWKRQRKRMEETVRFASGIDMLRDVAPLCPQIFGGTEYDGFTVEKFIIQTLPGFFCTGNIYRPTDATKRYPVILNPHGHWKMGRLDTDELSRVPQRCINQALRGMVAISYDMVGCGDSRQLPHSYSDKEFDKWNYGRFSLQLLNSVKVVDFACTLPYADSERIGCTGCSGGGTQTYFLALTDPRIKASAPINMASCRMQGGCVCENAPFLRTEFNNVDYTAAFAPRPLFMAAADGDWTVSSETLEFPAVESVYGLFGARNRFEHFYRSAPHCYDKETREKVYDFFCRAFGMENPFDGEIDYEIDTDSLRIGDIRSRVPSEGFIENDAQLFGIVKEILTAKTEKLSKEEKHALCRRVFLAEEDDDLDIPYIVRETEQGRETVLGDCPAKADTCGAVYYHCYNKSADAVRVGALYRMIRGSGSMTYRASGKTAFLLHVAAALAGMGETVLTNPDGTDANIPGVELALLAMK